MKKLATFVIFALILGSGTYACTPPHHGYHGGYYGGRYYHGYHYSGSSVYVIRTDYNETTSNFTNCKDHSLLTETTTHYLSNGGRRTYINHNILNKEGTILVANCSSVQHIILNNQHYFIVKQKKHYKILSDNGAQLNKRTYTYLKEIAPNRFLARADKRYGIIDLNEKLISQLKYNDFEQATDKLFITKLNGYYGIINYNGDTLFDNNYDKISTLYDTFLIKQYDKYGLADINGNLIAEVKFDKIKKLKEYILLKYGKNYSILDATGKPLGDKSYRKIKIERNLLMGQIKGKIWEEIKINGV